MALRIGTRVGSFELTGTLGAGGMGEVYRARDSNPSQENTVAMVQNFFDEVRRRVK